MTLESSNETLGILYDIENAPFEMLDYTLKKARRYQPCRTIVISDWEARPEQKRWEKLMQRQGFTFRQIDRTFHGKNSLDYALFASAKLLYAEGVRRFFIITTDSDFVKIAEMLTSGEHPSYIIGVGTKQASETLRNAYDEFFCYPPEGRKQGAKEKKVKDGGKQIAEKKSGSRMEKKTAKAESRPVEKKAVKAESKPVENKVNPAEKKQKSMPEGMISVKLPKTLQQDLRVRAAEEGVSMDELVTYLLMRGMMK